MEFFKRKKACNAFTLAEVLIVIAVIGVIAALSVPILVNSTNNKTYVDGMLRAYSILKTATGEIMTDNGGTMIQAGSSNANIRDQFCTILNCIETCNSSVDDNCIENAVTLHGGSPGFDFNQEGAILDNGMSLVFNAFFSADARNCILDGHVISGQNVCCGEIMVDINGSNAPNKIGRDVFSFQIYNQGIVPDGAVGTSSEDWSERCDTGSTNSFNGEGCAGKIIAEGNRISY